MEHHLVQRTVPKDSVLTAIHHKESVLIINIMKSIRNMVILKHTACIMLITGEIPMDWSRNRHRHRGGVNINKVDK